MKPLIQKAPEQIRKTSDAQLWAIAFRHPLDYTADAVVAARREYDRREAAKRQPAS